MSAFQPEPILQSRLLDPPWALPAGPRLPGISPIDPDDWLRLDDAFAAQMALRDRLIAEMPEAVHALMDQAREPAAEMLERTLELLMKTDGYHVGTKEVSRPDGVSVPIDRAAPLLTLGRLVQQDICILQKLGKEHLLTGAILCFPASWSLLEKLGRPLTGVHAPVDEYSADLARRVQRLFDAIRPDRGLMRANCLLYAEADLFQPRREADRRAQPGQGYRFVRTERQCLLRLPRTDAVIFTIHTTVMRREDLTPEDAQALAHYLERHQR